MDTYHHEDLRSELLEAGISLVARDGILSCSLRKVAAECKVSHGAPYSHFKNKDELLKAMQEYITELFSESLEKALKEISGSENPLLKLGETYFNFFVDNPNYYNFLFGHANISLDLRNVAPSGTNYKPYEIFKNLVLSILKINRCAENKQNDIVISLWAYIHGLTSLATMKNVTYDKNWKEKICDFISLYECKELKGIGQ